MKLRSVLTVCSLLGLAPRAGMAQAGECSGAKSWVVLGGDVPASFAEAVRADLRAGLGPTDIEVCAGAEARLGQPHAEPLARVQLEPLGNGRYGLDVTDSVTKKRIGRDLSLENLPPENRAFALAVAAEELLRASWAELGLRGARTAQTAPPPEVRAVVERSAAPPRSAPTGRYPALGARLAFERFLGGQTHYGADLFGAVPFGQRLRVTLALGARRALSVQAPHGAIGANALSAEGGLSFELVARGGLDFGGLVSARVLRVRFEPESSPGVAANAHSGLAVTSRWGLALAFGRPGVVRSYSSLGAGLLLKSFAAADNGGVVTGVSKLELFATTGLAWELP